MVFYAFFAALTIGISCLVSAKSVRWQPESTAVYDCRIGGCSRKQALSFVMLGTLFILLTALAALRIQVGNDYVKYVEIFSEIWKGTDEAYVVTEPGFNLVVDAVYTLSGFENYLLVFAVFGAATAFVFLKAMYEQSDDFAGSFAMFMLLGLYFRSFTTVRYYFVLALTLYSIRYIRRREFAKFLLLIVFAAFFHKSVLVVIPLYLIAALPWKKWIMISGAVCAALVVVFQRQILELALWFVPTFRGTIYLTQDVGLRANASGILRCLLVLFLALWCAKEPVWEKWECRFYLKLSVLGFLLYTCGSFLPLADRLAYYLITPQILLVPAMLKQIASSKKRRVIYVCTALCLLVYFGLFLMEARGSGISVLPYKSWIFTDKEWINASEFF